MCQMGASAMPPARISDDAPVGRQSVTAQRKCGDCRSEEFVKSATFHHILPSEFKKIHASRAMIRLDLT